MDGPLNISYLFNASSILLQPGADGSFSNYAKRGIMSLQQKSQWAELYPGTFFGRGGDIFQASNSTTAVLDGSFGFNDMTIQNNIDPKSNDTWGLCSYCGLSESDVSNELDYKTKSIALKLASIFQASLLKSKSPATALQALFTIVNFMQHYDR